jgi:hypothetical protein
MAITTPDAVPGEVIEAAWGDAVRADLINLDTNKLSLSGGTMTGALSVQNPTLAHHATRKDYVDAGDAGRVLDTGDTMTGDLRLGGTVSLDQSGLVHAVTGMISSTVTVPQVSSDPNVTMNRGGGAAGQPAANGGVYVRFARPWATTIGTITILNSTTVAYNTTSDKRLKRLTRPVDGDEALDRLAALEPVNFTFASHPEDGEQIGFFAQDAYAYAPEAVSPGSGEPGDDGFTPWMMDVGKLVPTLVAAVQALTRRNADLEARIATLEGATV